MKDFSKEWQDVLFIGNGFYFLHYRINFMMLVKKGRGRRGNLGFPTSMMIERKTGKLI
jgi:hypothetical protein